MPSAVLTKRLFLTGATGYIGGDALRAIMDRYPEGSANITALVRSQTGAAALQSAYPKISIVYGTLDDAGVIAAETAKADIVVNLADADHVAGTRAIVAGLQQRAAAGKQTFLIHNSGTGILMFQDIATRTYGEPSTVVFDDWEGVRQVVAEALPDSAPHRDVDKIVLAAGTDATGSGHHGLVKTAIVCPPTIYGVGRGTGNQRSAQIPLLAEAVLKHGQGFQVGRGLAEWTNVHVSDLSTLYALLVGEALEDGGQASWGADGYYFAQNGTHLWGDVCHKVTEIAFAKGLIQSDKVEQLSAEEVNKINPIGAMIWGHNSKCKAIRARRLLGWAPAAKSLVDELPTAVEYEAKRLAIRPCKA